MTNIKNEQLLEWLISRNDTPLQFKIKQKSGEDMNLIFFRWKVEENLDVIYGKYIWTALDNNLQRKDGPTYLGIFYHVDQMMYDTRCSNYHFMEFIEQEQNKLSKMDKKLEEKVRQRIWDLLDTPNDGTFLASLSPWVEAEYERFCEDELENKAFACYVKEKSPRFFPYWDFHWTDTSICKFIEDPEGLANEIVNEMKQEHRERIFLSYKELKAIEKRMDEIKNDPSHPAQAARRIKESIDVFRSQNHVRNVTIGLLDKEQNEVQFKIDVDNLLAGIINGFGKWSPATKKDRELFEERMADPSGYYYAKDIVSISFGKKCLYLVEQYGNRVHYMSWDSPSLKKVIELDAQDNGKGEK